MYFFKNSKKNKKSRELFFTKWKEKKCLKVKPLEKKDKIKFSKKSKWVPMYFFKNSKNQENYFTKWKGKKCLKVKPLEKKVSQGKNP